MTDGTTHELRELLERLARITSADQWQNDLNPAQLAALSYLARANRHSRAPSQVAEYLSAMRGTVSGTLKALARKQLITEEKSATDKRRTSYNITAKGQKALQIETAIDTALAAMNDKSKDKLYKDIKQLVTEILQVRGGRSFGVCATCKYHDATGHGARCSLLDIDLQPQETSQICYEHRSAA